MRVLKAGRWFCLLLLATPLLPTRAAALPDWAGTIKMDAPAVDGTVTEEEFRVLWSERHVTVDAKGHLRVRDRIAKQALSDHGEDVGIGGFFLGPGAKVRKSRAWHSLPGGKTTKSRRSDAIDISGFDSFLTDRTVRSVAIEGIREGSIVFFEFEGEWTPYILAMDHTFAHSEVVDVSRLVIDLPAGWKLHWDWLHGGGVEPQAAGNTYTFELKGLHYPIEEDLALSVSERAPLVYLAFEPPADVGVPYMKTWADLGNWVEQLGEKPGTITPEVEAAVTRAAGETGSIEAVLSCGEYVRDKVRYVAKAIGIGGYKPHYADETLRRLWGDCKDKATLLRAMLEARDLESYPVLVSLTEDETVSEKVPSLGAFDHEILAVKLPADAADLDRFEHAILEDAQLGRLLIVDTTDEYTSLGWMSGSLSGRRALIVAGEKSHLATLPGKQPGAHRREREMTMRIASDRSAKMTLTTRSYGAMSSSYRRRCAQSQKDLRDSLESTVHDAWTGAHIEDVTFSPEEEDGAFVSTVTWSVDALPKSAEGSIVTPFPRAAWALASTAVRRRKTPVVYDFPRRISTAVTIEGVPEEVSLPAGKLRKGEGWSVERAFSREGTTVQARWSFELEKTRFEVEDLKSLRSLYRALRSVKGVILTIR